MIDDLLGKRVAAAGFIYLLLPRRCSTASVFNPRFAASSTPEERISASLPCLQIFVLLLPQETVCPVRCQPLSRVSGRKRYNTLDFAAQNRVPTGRFSPLLETLSQRDCIPLDTPFFFTLRRSNYENAVCHRCEEKQKEASAPGS